MNTTAPQDLEAVFARLADLEAAVAAQDARSVPAPLPELYRPQPPVQRTTVALATLRGQDGLPRDFRVLRQLAAAVALGKGDPLPGAMVRREYVPVMVKLHGLRARGLSWRAAYAEVPGVDTPSEGEVAHQARQLRAQLSGMWDGLLPVLAVLERRLPGSGGRDLIETFRRLLI